MEIPPGELPGYVLCERSGMDRLNAGDLLPLTDDVDMLALPLRPESRLAAYRYEPHELCL